LEAFMLRRSDPFEMVNAGDKLRGRFDAQQHAAGCFGAASQAVRLRAQLDELDRQQQKHAAKLADTLNVATATDITGWPRTRITEALRSQRPRPPQPAGAAAPSPNGERD
jgi:hypothetical protein